MGKNTLLRVTQMNAIFFDKEINNLLWQHIQDILKYVPPGLTSPFEPEMRLLLRLSTTAFSIVQLNRTFGQKLLQIQYENLTPLKKVLILLSNTMEYIRQRFGQSSPNTNTNSLLQKFYIALVIGNFLSISIFLRTGKKPQLYERLLSLNQVYEHDNIQRHFDTKYMTRELLWNGLIEILVFVLPLLNYHKIRRLTRYLNPFHKKPNIRVSGIRNITINTKCSYCGEYPVSPHHIGCPHIFCYYCVKGNLLADSKYDCPICEHQSNGVCELVEVQ